jgi:TRAP-type C4-dicarboxylate transport system permease small subunit
MMKKLQAYLVVLSRAMAWLAGASLVAMVAFVVLDVLGRHVIPGFALNGAIELAVVCVVLLAYFGLPWAFASNAHIIVDVATTAAPERVRRGLDAFWLVVSAAIAAVFFWLVLITGFSLHGYGEVSEILRMSPLVTYGAGAFGLLVTVAVALNTAVARWRGADPEAGDSIKQHEIE